jgi:hypothetical protein
MQAVSIFVIDYVLIGRQVFERLKNKTDLNEQKRQQDEINARTFAQQHKAQERLGELVCILDVRLGRWLMLG